MDTQLMTQLLALLTALGTLYQEVRHRKNAKKERAKLEDIMPGQPVSRGKK